MSPKTNIDCRGLSCPQPVLQVKKALDSITVGTITAIVDNDTARENVSTFARNAGYSAEVEKEGSNFKITIVKGSPVSGGETSSIGPAREGEIPIVYLITSNILGQGSPDLGQVLMKSLMVTLNEMTPPPLALLFLNTGVMSACEGSPVLEQLQSLSSKGTAVISCGTCLDYYKIKEKLLVGRVGNMMEINGYLTGDARVITVA
ncbi:MAG: sulfurtransferase-like selenium metabolism protein YedF [Actinobacteria bacterium]|nr:sulfurtransferase-like selenium metabolism protein YedF [Actinomycetota bacterium]